MKKYKGFVVRIVGRCVCVFDMKNRLVHTANSPLEAKSWIDHTEDRAVYAVVNHYNQQADRAFTGLAFASL